MANSEVTMCGNLATEPEIQPTKNSTLCRFRLAVNDRRKQGNDWVDDPSFFTVICWQDLASHAAESLSKGDRVVVKGRVKENTWTDNEGVKKSTVEMVAEDIGVSIKFATVDGIQKITVTQATKPTGKGASELTGFPKDEEPF